MSPKNLARVTEMPVNKNWFQILKTTTGKVLKPQKKNKFNDCDWFEKYDPNIHPKRFGFNI